MQEQGQEEYTVTDSAIESSDEPDSIVLNIIDMD